MTLPAQVRGFLIDIDGTVMEAQSLVPGVPEALALLRVRNVPFRLVTNTTSKPRSAILTRMQALAWTFRPTLSSRRRSLAVNISCSVALLVVTLC